MKKVIFIVSAVFLLISCKESTKKQVKAAHKKTSVAKVDYATLGMQYAMNTQKVLGKNLMKAIKTKGTAGAVAFCNTRAYPLTDSMSVVQKVVIKRVSDRNRNKKNAANTEEISYINSFKEAISQNKPTQPIVKEVGDKVHFYAPIVTVPKCLQCHGTVGKEVKPAVFKTIKKLYPEDKATGYSVNQVRGLWHITFSKK